VLSSITVGVVDSEIFASTTADTEPAIVIKDLAALILKDR
jgi:hypothetical protein